MTPEQRRLNLRDKIANLCLSISIDLGIEIDPVAVMENCHQLTHGPFENLEAFMVKLFALEDLMRQREFDAVHNNSGERRRESDVV